MNALPIGELARLDALVRTHQRSVRAYLAWLGCPAVALDDLVQDTFLSAFAAGFRDQGESAARVYLRTVARHLLLKRLRRERSAPARVEFAALEAELAEFERDDGGAAQLDALRDCLDSLAGRARAAIRLRYGEDRSEAEIGATLDLGLAGVGALLVRTRKKLRACVERRMRS